MAKALLLLAAGVSLLAAACAGAGDGPSTSREVSSEYIAAAETAVADALLTLEDLPEGWSAEPQDDDDGVDPEFTEPCEIFNEDEFPGQIAQADSDQLIGPDAQQVFVTVVAFPTAGLAGEALDLYGEFTTSGECRDQLESAMTVAFKDSFREKGYDEPAVASVTASVDDLPFPDIDASPQTYRIAWGATAQGQKVSGKMDFVYWQQERMLGGMLYASTDPDVYDQLTIARLIAGKMEHADASLSDVSVYVD